MKSELAYIQSDSEHAFREDQMDAASCLHKQTWAIAAGKFMIESDPIWWFYLFWIPDYLQREHGFASDANRPRL